MPARLKWLLVAVLLLDALFVLWSVAVNQLRVVVVTGAPATLTIDDGARTQTLRAVAAPSDFDLRIRQAGAAAISVQPLRTGHGALLSDSADYRASGSFAVEGDLRKGGHWHSISEGSELAWRGRAAGLSVTLPCSPESGTACVVAGTEAAQQCHDLSTCERNLTLALPGPRQLHHALVPLWRPALQLDSAAPVAIERLSVWFGTRLVFERGDFVLSQRIAVAPLEAGSGALLAGLFGDGVKLFARILLLVAVMVLCGACLVTPAIDRVSIVEAGLLAFFAGQALTANATTALHYLLPTRTGWPLVLATLAGLTAVQLACGGWRRWQQAFANTNAAEWRALRLLVLVASLACLVAAFPAVAFPGWFVGQGYTDTAEYAGWASLAQAAPIDRGLGAIRFEDFVRLALTSQILGIGPRAALAPQILVLWWVLPFLAWSLLRRLGVATGSAVAGAALAAHGFCFFAIATQCYLPHYEVVHFVLAGIWATAWFVDDRRTARAPGGLWAEAVLGAVFAAAIGLYPYQAFSALAFGVVWLLVAAVRRSPAILWSALRVGMLAALICNVNLEVIRDFGAGSMQHREALNAIGRHIVFPWHGDAEAKQVLAGTDDFVRNSALADEFAAELFAALPKAGARFQRLERALRETVPALTSVVLLLASGALLWLLRRRDRASLVAFTTMLFPLVMALSLMLTDDVYFWVKSMMTLAALMVVPVAGCLVWLVGSRVPGVGIAALAIALWFVAASVRTAWFDSAGYFLNRESAVLAKARNHLAVAGEALWRFETWVGALPPGQRVVFLGKLQDRYGTTDDKLTYNRLLEMLDGHRVAWGEGQSKRYTRDTEIGYRGREPLASFDWAVSFDSCKPPPGSVPVLKTDLFCVFPLRPL